MSTVQTNQASMAPYSGKSMQEIRIISHCTLFYWWPVWALGFILSLITYFSGQRLYTVPVGTEALRAQEVKGIEGKRDVLVLPAQAKLTSQVGSTEPVEPHLYISGNKNLGVLFCIVLLLVIAITNIPLRGLWSFIVIMFIVSLSIIFSILGWWEPILAQLSILDIRINLGGYFLISTVLFLLWLVVFMFFDQQIYMIFAPRQLRVRLEIGDAETAYDTTGMRIEKQRSDLFRHWILGLGSGDLIVHIGGNNPHTFHMPNVLFLGRKMKHIEKMLQVQVVSAQ